LSERAEVCGVRVRQVARGAREADVVVVLPRPTTDGRAGAWVRDARPGFQHERTGGGGGGGCGGGDASGRAGAGNSARTAPEDYIPCLARGPQSPRGAALGSLLRHVDQLDFCAVGPATGRGTGNAVVVLEGRAHANPHTGLLEVDLHLHQAAGTSPAGLRAPGRPRAHHDAEAVVRIREAEHTIPGRRGTGGHCGGLLLDYCGYLSPMQAHHLALTLNQWWESRPARTTPGAYYGGGSRDPSSSLRRASAVPRLYRLSLPET